MLRLAVVLAGFGVWAAGLASGEVVGFWQFNEAASGNASASANSILDTSGKNLNGYGGGTPTPSYVPGNRLYESGSALRFTTADDSVLVPDNALLDFDAGDSFTIEAMVRTSQIAAVGAGIVVKRAPSTETAPRPGYWLRGYTKTVNGVQVMAVEGIVIDSAGNNRISGTTNIADGAWHHVAVVYNAASDLLSVYLDYALEGSTPAARGDLSNNVPLNIGDWYDDAPANRWAGDIDFVRITKGTLSTSEFIRPSLGACCSPNGTCADVKADACSAAWQGEGTSCSQVLCQTTDGAVGFWEFNEACSGNAGSAAGSIDDHSGHNLTGAGVGDPTPAYVTGAAEYGLGSALSFAGEDDAVVIPIQTAMNFAEGASFTLEALIRTTSKGGSQGIVVKRAASTVSGARPGYWLRTTTKTVNDAQAAVIEGIVIDANGNDRASGTTDLSDGQWHHVAMVYAKDANQLRVYVDQVLEGTTTTNRGDLSNDADLIIGGWYDADSGLWWSGDIDFAKLTAAALFPADFVQPLPMPGACCHNNGSCDETLRAACSGEWLGADTSCADCPGTGACCMGDGSCVQVIESACTGEFHGEGSTCAETNCGGACCRADGSCVDTVRDSCTGEWEGGGTTCASTTCPPVRKTPDLIKDGRIDQLDLERFVACATGSAISLSDPNCAEADFDRDSDVDMTDFGMFQLCIGSNGDPIGPSCLYGSPRLVAVSRIWSQAAHNAFTDLIRFQDAWYCTFREAPSHSVTPAAQVRVITSMDAATWTSAGLFSAPTGDLRDPKLSITPDGRLMLLACERYTASNTGCTGGDVFHPYVAFSSDGTAWSPLQAVTVDGQIPTCEWLWRVTWHKGMAYGISYAPITTAARRLSIWTSSDGIQYTSVSSPVVPGGAGETTVRFWAGDQMIALARNQGNLGQIGISNPPYTSWTWHATGYALGGPDFIQLPNGALWAASRYTVGGTFTAVSRLTSDTYEPLLVLPSSGDTGYPGLVWYGGRLWVSYYSSHEGKDCIYLAQVELPAY